MTTIKTSSASSLVNVFGAVGTAASAINSTFGLADDYITGAAQSAKVYRARASADAEQKIKLASVDAKDTAAAWLLQRRKAILATLTDEGDVEMFNDIKTKYLAD